MSDLDREVARVQRGAVDTGMEMVVIRFSDERAEMPVLAYFIPNIGQTIKRDNVRKYRVTEATHQLVEFGGFQCLRTYVEAELIGASTQS